MAVTRLGLHGTSAAPFGSFAGKVTTVQDELGTLLSSDARYQMSSDSGERYGAQVHSQARYGVKHGEHLSR
jgi:hypothetical protein